jgi:ribosomal protein S18 acetylase RimI-like enzyme
VQIRRATIDDAAALARVHIDSRRSAYRGLIPDSFLATLDLDHWTQRFRDVLSSNTEAVYVAEEEEAILGFLIIGGCRDTDLEQDETGEIWGIYLAPEHWRRGIGRRLCRKGEHILKSHGYTGAVLWVFEGNDRARDFYSTMGFEPDGASKWLEPGTSLKALRYIKGLE